MSLTSKDILRLEQLDEQLEAFRPLLHSRPRRGWLHALQKALGVTNVQLAKLTGRKPQTIEDIQEYEAKGNINLGTLQELADKFDAEVVYAIVPRKSLFAIREDQAKRKARALQKMVSHTMRLEAQGLSKEAEESEFNRMVRELLAGNPKKLW